MRHLPRKFQFLIGLVSLSIFLSGCASGCPPTCLGENIGGVDWSGKNLNRAQLINITARQSNLGRVNFSSADLSGTDLTGSILQSSNLSNATLIGANLQKAYLSGAIFTNTNLTGAILDSTDLTGVSLTSTNLAAVSFIDSRLVNADLSQLNLAGSYMDRSKMAGIKMNRVNLAGGLLDKADLSGADLRSADIRGGWVNLASLVAANLQDANLSGASLIGTDLTGANLSGASLAGANLVGANLRGADLRGADLRAAELVATSDLLDWKNFDDNTLSSLSEAQWNKLELGDAILDGAKYDNLTIWPDGFTPPAGVIYQPWAAGIPPVQSSGKQILISGSSTVADLALPLSRAYTQNHPDLFFKFIVTDSATGISDVGNGQADIGMSSRVPDQAELNSYPDLNIFPLAIDSLAVVANLDNHLNNLTVENLRSIYAGEITNWKDLGGKDIPINPIQQNNTLILVFKELVMGSLPMPGAGETLPSNAAVRAAVAADPGAIGILPRNFVDDSLQILAVNGFMPTTQAIATKQYPLIRPLYLITRSKPSGETKAWLDFILSETGRKTILREELEPVSR